MSIDERAIGMVNQQKVAMTAVNTPRTPKRMARSSKRMEQLMKNIERAQGAVAWQLTDAEYLQALGLIVVTWPQVEQQMAHVLGLLLGQPHTDVTDEIWHSLPGNVARINMMQALLENTTVNRDISDKVDHLISEFSRLNKKRNEFVHAIWTTDENGMIEFSPQRLDPRPALFRKEVILSELLTFVYDALQLRNAGFFEIQAEIRRRADDSNQS